VWASLALHAGCLGLGLGRALSRRSRPNGRRPPATAAALLVADHAALALAGLWPRSRVLGPNLVRLPEDAARRGEVSLTFDDGPDPSVTPAVLDLLERHGAYGSFFCVGERVERWPELAAEIVRRGHRVENHTYSHPWQFSLLGARGIAREIDRAQAVIRRATGESPRLVRAPAGLRNLLLEPVLARRGLWLASWTRRGLDAFGADPGSVLGRLERNLRAGDVLVLHDGPAATGGRLAERRTGKRAPGRRPPVLEVLPALLERLESAGLRSVPVPVPVAAPSSAEGSTAGEGTG
jgi:peptidoglycan/xylan/chitin deacetylase (PgdA/CDA1 family)